MDRFKEDYDFIVDGLLYIKFIGYTLNKSAIILNGLDPDDIKKIFNIGTTNGLEIV